MDYIEERALNLYLAQNKDARLFPPHMTLMSLRGTLLFETIKIGILVDDLKIQIKALLLEIKHSVINAWKGLHEHN